MLHVDRAAKHFNAVIQATVYLHMAHNGAVATTTEGQAVEFVVAGNFVTGKLDARVFEQATTAGRVIAAEGATTVAVRNAFNARIGDIDRRAAEQHHATPVTGAPRAHRLRAAEYHRFVGAATRVKLCATTDDQGRARTPEHACARFQCQAAAGRDKHQSVE